MMPNPSLGELFTQVFQKINQMHIHCCVSGEYNGNTLVPNIANPDEQTFYLVPDGSGNNVYTEWIYINNNWERFGNASINLSGYATTTYVDTKVPNPPSTDGTYTLQATVSSGTNTYTWVAGA